MHKTLTNNKWQLRVWGCLILCLAGLKETLVFWASQAVKYISFCFKMFQVYFMPVFPGTRRSGVHLSRMSPSESEGQKNVVAKATHSPPRHASCQLNTLLVTTTVDCYCKYSRVLDLGCGSTQTDMRRETDGTQQEHWQCLLLAYFFIRRHGHHTKYKASDACYRWRRIVPVDGTCISLPARLADDLAASVQLKQNLVWLCCYTPNSDKAAVFICISASEGRLIL